MIFWLDRGGTKTYVLLFIRASNSRCIACCHLGTLAASLKEFGSQGEGKIVSIGDRNILGLKMPFLARVVMEWQEVGTWKEGVWVLGIGATSKEKIDTLASKTRTNSKGGLDGGGKREDIEKDGTAKGMEQWEGETKQGGWIVEGLANGKSSS